MSLQMGGTFLTDAIVAQLTGKRDWFGLSS